MWINLERVVRRILPSVRPGQALSHGERRTLVRVAEVLLEGAAVDIQARQVATNVETFLVAGRSRRAWRVRVLLRVIELAPMATHRRSFSRLSLTERRVLVRERWMTGGHVYRLCAKIRNLVILGAYGDPHAAEATGYVPVPLRPRFQSGRLVALTVGAA
jgi:hypothetical protein